MGRVPAPVLFFEIAFRGVHIHVLKFVIREPTRENTRPGGTLYLRGWLDGGIIPFIRRYSTI